MRRKLSHLALTLSLSCLAVALSVSLSTLPAMSAPLATAKSLRADAGQIVLVRAARGGAYRGGSVHRGGTGRCLPAVYFFFLAFASEFGAMANVRP